MKMKVHFKRWDFRGWIPPAIYRLKILRKINIDFKWVMDIIKTIDKQIRNYKPISLQKVRNLFVFKFKGFNRKSIFNPSYLIYRTLIPDIESTKKYANGIVLDVGSGSSPYRYVFEPCAAEYITLDIDPKRGRIDIIASAMDLPFRDSSIDTVICFQVVEHLPSPERFFSEVKRVLKNGGHLICSLPQQWRLHEKPYDFFRFTCYGIKQLCNQSGLKLLYVKPNGGAWAMIGQSIINIIGRNKWFVPVYLIINIIFSMLDRIWYDPDDTMNYIFVAQKPDNLNSSL